MEIKINEKELNCLAQLVFLGNYVINGGRMPEARLKAYDDIAEKIYGKQSETICKTAERDAEEDGIGNVRDDIYDSISLYLAEYEREVFLEKLGERIADINYPASDGDPDTVLLNMIAGERYIKILKEKGESFVYMSAPKIDGILKKS